MAITSGDFTIGSDVGDDYASIRDFEADISTMTGAITGTCRDEELTDSTFGAISFSGHGTSGTNTLVVAGGSDEGSGSLGSAFKSFAEFKAETDFKLRYGCGGGYGGRTNFTNNAAGITLNESNLEFRRLQLKQGGNGTLLFVASSAVADRCILFGDGSRITGWSRNFIYNSLIYKSGPTLDGLLLDFGGEAKNCTILLPDDVTPTNGVFGVQDIGGGSSANNVIDNSAVFGYDTDDAFEDDTDLTGTDNATDDTGTVPARVNATASLTYADQFENVNETTLDARLKSGNDLEAGCTRDSTYTKDILDVVRPSGAGAAAIGCVELVAGGSNPHNPLGHPLRGPFGGPIG